jgi:hypothetical protein
MTTTDAINPTPRPMEVHMSSPMPPAPSTEPIRVSADGASASRAPRRGLWIGVAALGAVVAVALGTSEWSGTGAANVGDTGRGPGGPAAAGTPLGAPGAACAATTSNPGGDNNYQPNAPLRPDLGQGFVIGGMVRGTDCAPLPGVRVQVWLATVEAGERANQASVLTGPDGAYSIDTAPVRSQFGEPNVHVAYDDGAYETVFLRNVVDEDDTSATIDLTLDPR